MLCGLFCLSHHTNFPLRNAFLSPSVISSRFFHIWSLEIGFHSDFDCTMTLTKIFPQISDTLVLSLQEIFIICDNARLEIQFTKILESHFNDERVWLLNVKKGHERTKIRTTIPSALHCLNRLYIVKFAEQANQINVLVNKLSDFQSGAINLRCMKNRKLAYFQIGLALS